jgi:hypothetical protein
VGDTDLVGVLGRLGLRLGGRAMNAMRLSRTAFWTGSVGASHKAARVKNAISENAQTLAEFPFSESDNEDDASNWGTFDSFTDRHSYRSTSPLF